VDRRVGGERDHIKDYECISAGHKKLNICVQNYSWKILKRANRMGAVAAQKDGRVIPEWVVTECGVKM
jgi:hypothetical protein